MEDVEKIVEKYDFNSTELIAVLHDIQEKYNYLPKDALEIVSEKLKIPLSSIYQIATFYKAYSLKPRGKHHIRVCLGTACHVRGAQRVLDSVERVLGIKPDETTEDGMYSLETVNCLGCCALGPVMVVDKNYHGQMDSNKVVKFLKKYR
jgi:NADH-quinone oxidoreductase subunit E